MSALSVQVSFEIWGFVITLFAAFLTRVVITDNKRKQFCLGEMQICGGLILLADGISTMYKGQPGSDAYYYVMVGNFVVFTCTCLVIYFYHGYFLRCLYPDMIRPDIKRLTLLEKIPFITTSISLLMVLSTPFTHAVFYVTTENRYQRGSLFIVELACSMLGIFIDFITLLLKRKKIKRITRIGLSSYMFLPLIGVVLAFAVPGFSWINMSTGIAMWMIFVEAIFTHVKESAEKKEELAGQQLSTAKSQIGPQFIMSILSSIRVLCRINPTKAEAALETFTKYLDENLKGFGKNTLVPFEDELEHVKNYMDLEQVRYGSRVSIEYDIQTSNFNLPPISLQPMVENAVRFGLQNSHGDIHIKISTYEKEDAYYTTITDDASGFEIKENELTDDIRSVDRRLRIMCMGQLQIKSHAGEPTEVKIRVPKLA